MPATEETYRSQRRLHIWFAISSIAMTLVTIWMVMADHLRPWKQVQREFQKVELAKIEATKEQRDRELKARHERELEEVRRKIAEAKETERKNARLIAEREGERRRIKGRHELLDTEKRFMKAEIDSQRSFYDGFIDRDLKGEALALLNKTIRPLEAKFATLTAEFEKVDQELKQKDAEIAELRGNIDKWDKQEEDLTRDLARVKRQLEQRQAQYGRGGPVSAFFAFLRDLPGIDMAAPPTKIDQISLPKLTINYNFKDVPRYDRCKTCHAGIDKLGFDTDADGKPMKATHPAFATHPHFTDGATTTDPKGNEVAAGLYLDANGPHPINRFGCTICHGGQGSGTDFTFASHEPNDLRQKAEWEEKQAWHAIHFWDEPMLPKRFMESSCLKCHHEVTDVPQATKLQAGYRRIVKYGCTGCHTIGGPGASGPDLTDNRQVGPNLKPVGYKVSKEWLVRWIKNPHAFRPDSRMPRFYGLTNNDKPQDLPKSHAEIQAIAHYLVTASEKPRDFEDRKEKGDPKRGQTLFLQKGCLACHSHRPYEPSEIKGEPNPKYKPDPATTYDPAQFPGQVREYAKANHGPNLSNIAAKFQSKEQGTRWLTNWIKAPENYHPESLMPNLQLSWQDAADLASWIISVPAEWPGQSEVPDINGQGEESKQAREALDELVRHFISKSNTYKPALSDTPSRTVLLSELEGFVARLSTDEKLMYLGERTISRMGCFGCHNIKGFEDAKPIGTPLNGWGFKSPAKLDFAHILEYLEEPKPDDQGNRDGTPPYYQEKLAEHQRPGFLFEKLHRPRSYDFQKTKEDLKAWDDRLRMPRFAWADDPEAIEEVMTFVLGLTGEVIPSDYLPRSTYSPAQFAKARGERLIERYNCKGCHVFEMPSYTIRPGVKVADAMPDFQVNFEASSGPLGRGQDYLKEFYPKLTYDPNKAPKLGPDDGRTLATIHGMPMMLEEVPDDSGKQVVQRRQAIQLWQPVTIRGYTFNRGDNVLVDLIKLVDINDGQKRTNVEPADGGGFAWLYAAKRSADTGESPDTDWNRLPPPLIREGRKVQTPWLTRFFKDPYPIRPATNLRMPRFHFGDAERTRAETATLANYFAAVDKAEFPYQDIPERERSYLAARESEHPDYLASGWQMMAKGACISCHTIGNLKPTGDPTKQINGPDLRQVEGRFRPDFLLEWLARPNRLVPYTVMPQNIPPHGDVAVPTPKSFEKQPFELVKTVRDTLLNYVDAVEGQLAGQGKAEPDKGGGKSKEAE
ncbi:MAG TPA: c-type cytochrome [Isosphaeraceae bacterium]|jgi:cbb3-type cytochrome oxidase cytochrome c subunit|nr:c-type cytochrome [Isosphaeraceae bacterium]